MPDEEESPFQKIQHACACCLGGWVLFPLTLYLLGWNEKKFVCEQKNIISAEADSVVTKCDSFPGNNKFVAFGCPINDESKKDWTMADFLTDAETKKSFGDNFKFRSLAAKMAAPEMYQCKESSRSVQDDTNCRPTKDKNGKTTSCPVHTEYSYSLGWATGRINFACRKDKWNDCTQRRTDGCPGLRSLVPGGGDTNPGLPIGLPSVREAKYASNPYEFKVGTGGLYITEQTESKDLFPADSVVPLKGMSWPGMGTKNTNVGVTNKFDAQNARISDNGNYIQTCSSDRIGCVRVSFSQNAAAGAAFIGDSGSGGKTQPRKMASSWGCEEGSWFRTKALKTKADILPGAEARKNIIDSANKNNESSLFWFRVLGVLGCWAAVYCCLYPIVAFFDIMEDYMAMVPCIGGCLSVIGQVVETLVQLVVCCMSCSFGCSAAFFTIAIVWLYMRPLQGILYMLGCILVSGGAYALAHMAPKKEGKQARDLSQELATPGGEEA